MIDFSHPARVTIVVADGYDKRESRITHSFPTLAEAEAFLERSRKTSTFVRGSAFEVEPVELGEST